MFNMLGVRLDARTERILAALAPQRRTTKSALARDAIRPFVTEATLAEQAREQSLRASRHDSGAPLAHDDRDWTR
jgi:predicted transcriptional regulator